MDPAPMGALAMPARSMGGTFPECDFPSFVASGGQKPAGSTNQRPSNWSAFARLLVDISQFPSNLHLPAITPRSTTVAPPRHSPPTLNTDSLKKRSPCLSGNRPSSHPHRPRWIRLRPHTLPKLVSSDRFPPPREKRISHLHATAPAKTQTQTQTHKPNHLLPLCATPSIRLFSRRRVLFCTSGSPVPAPATRTPASGVHHAAMATFNSMSGLSVASGSGADSLRLRSGTMNPPNGAGGLGLDGFDQDMTFDEAMLENVNGLASLPFTPSYDFETFSTTFEDPFPYSSAAAARPYELAPHDPEIFHESASPQEGRLDNKLLGFSAPVIKAAIADETGQFAEPAMTAELFGMFFLAEDVYSAENTGRPLELTCYRRNLWWCSGLVALPRQVTHAVTDQGRHVAVHELAVSISAIESIEGKPTEIICIPWKSTPTNGANSANSHGHSHSSQQGDDTTKVAGSPLNVPIDIGNGQELENGLVEVPFSWKRLQFKHATANNGRRKGQQQHYVVQINLLARTRASGSGDSSGGTDDRSSGQDDSQDWVKIAEIQSGPVIVRGRSPRNFVSRRDVPLSSTSSSGSVVVDKKQTPQLLDRSNLVSSGGIDSSALQPNQSSTNSNAAQSFQRFGMGSIPAGDWTHGYAQQSPHPAKKMALSPGLPRPPVPAWSNETPALRTMPKMVSQPPHHQPQPQQSYSQHPHHPQRPSSTAAPISLSLSEDERSPTRAGADRPSSSSPPYSNLGRVSARIASAKAPATKNTTTTTSSGIGGGRSSGGGSAAAAAAAASDNPFENGELLYEYFPLSLDDWMPPVDAIYRPHVVHHTVVPPEVKAQQVRNKTKRYFLAE